MTKRYTRWQMAISQWILRRGQVKETLSGDGGEREVHSDCRGDACHQTKNGALFQRDGRAQTAPVASPNSSKWHTSRASEEQRWVGGRMANETSPTRKANTALATSGQVEAGVSMRVNGLVACVEQITHCNHFSPFGTDTVVWESGASSGSAFACLRMLLGKS